MPDRGSVLVCGIDELASAVARTLLLAGHAVALHQAGPPGVLRRKMSFCDAWFEGVATLGGVEARRVTRDADLLAGLRGGMFIPLLTLPRLAEVGRWPWDAVVDARGGGPGDAADRTGLDAELCLVLGPGGSAGVDCDLVMEVGGIDPGALVRAGAARAGPRGFAAYDRPVVAPVGGVFSSLRTIGEAVRAGEMIGLVGTALVSAPCDGRLRGLLRPGCTVAAGAPVAEVVAAPQVQVSGVDRGDAMIARAVDFTLTLESEGLDPLAAAALRLR